MNQLREAFLKYFDRLGHLACASTPIVPRGDPSLLFTSAGMVPFKPYFLGIKSGLSRTASCQRCLRTTDIERVGSTIRHLTFFEMLGNFSFGDYFKADAIHWAWEFLIREMRLDPARLHPTVFREDDEAMALWAKESPPNPVRRLDEDSNFWNMGPTGPCGPCSEIYYDLGPGLSCGKPSCAPGCDCDRYLEIWNLVFTQFDRQEDGSLKPLPRKNIDTGMGLERLALAVQGKKSPFETDLLLPVVQEAGGLLRSSLDAGPDARKALRIVADHARAASVLAAEGVIPSNVERGYVLRRLIRRAVRYGQLLGRREPFLHLLSARVLEVLGPAYPELAKAGAQIEQTLQAEEERFLSTLEKGERELQELLDKRPASLSGELAFKLYDTFGFPFELTEEICLQHGLRVDPEGFARARARAAEVARSGWRDSGERASFPYEKIAAANPGMHSEFRGYSAAVCETRVDWVLRLPQRGAAAADAGAPGQELRPGDDGELVLHKTPFYPEGGGQVGDRGMLYDDLGDPLAEVHDAHRPHPNLIVHRVTARRLVRAGMKARAEVDPEHRRMTAYHHTATHLLNEALRRVLGPHVRQAGSLVAPDRLRFDFTHPKPLSPREIAAVEASVNSAIEADMPVEPQERAAADVETLGAVTLLGESYGERPRFVLIAPQGWASPRERYSLELCGGTHVARTGEIRRFKIVKESSVAAGIRRVEAVAGPALEEHQRALAAEGRRALREAMARYLQLASQFIELTGRPLKPHFKSLPDPDAAPLEEVRAGVEALKEAEKALKAELGELKRQTLASQAQRGKVLLDVGRLKVCVQKFREAEPASLRSIADQLKREMGSGVVFLGSADSDRLSFVVGVTQDLVGKGLNASRLAQSLAESIGGKAGGRPDFAQGGGPEGDWDRLVGVLNEALRPHG